MQRIKQILFMVALALSFGAYSNTTYAQDVVVKVKPHMPHFEHGAAPSPKHVWIGEEWEPRDGTYAFVGGHWAMPPQPHMVWISGHWRETPHGSVWDRGHWMHKSH